jgi:transcription initiation factor IIE alpha subunit
MSNNLRTCEKHEDAVVIFKWEKECPLCKAETAYDEENELSEKLSSELSDLKMQLSELIK